MLLRGGSSFWRRGVVGHDFLLLRGSEAIKGGGEGMGGGLASRPSTVWKISKNRGVLDANLMHFY